MRRVMTALRRLDDHWLGDVIAAACLFGTVPVVLFLGAVLGPAQ